MSLFLGLDTTSRHASIAVSEDDDVLIEYNFITRDELSATLIPAITFILNSIHVPIEEIDVFGIGIGPGLFTGIRVGLTSLKGMAFTNHRPIVPVITLEALAWKFRRSHHPIVPLIDARRREVYMAAYRFSDPTSIREIYPPCLMNIDMLKGKLEALDDFRLTGSGVTAYSEELSRAFPGRKTRNRSSFLASEICRISSLRFASGQAITRLEDLSPLYLREPDARTRREKQSSAHPKS